MTARQQTFIESLPDRMSVDQAQQLMQGQVYPVVLTHESDYAPIFGVGTAFLLEHGGHLFAISAQHVLDSQFASSDDFMLLVKGTAMPMLFDRSAVFQSEYEPHFDLLIRRISPLQHEIISDSGAFWLDTSAGLHEDGFPEVERFFVFGYPEDGREYDYETQRLSASIDVLIGNHADPQVPGLGTIQITASACSSYRGLSGSLVIADIDEQWRFAGMVTMGSEASSLVNFIPASVIAYYLARLQEMEAGSDYLPE